MAFPARFVILALGLSAAAWIAPGSPRRAQAGGGGERLLAEQRCLLCHAAPAALRERIATPPAPRLDDAGARLNPSFLRGFLADPSSRQPGTVMPDVLHGLDPAAKAETVEDLVHYLASRGGPLPGELVEVAPGELERGKRLYHTAGCAACHPAEIPAQEVNPEYGGPPPLRRPDLFDEVEIASSVEPAPPGVGPAPLVPLPDLAGKTDLASLSAFLLDPKHARPAGRMPALGLQPQEARAIAAWLLRAQMDSGPDTGLRKLPGLSYAYYEESFADPDPPFDSFTPRRLGHAPQPSFDLERREENFGFRFWGWIEIVTPGFYRFFLESDDGSRLFLDGRLLVDHNGQHGMEERGAAVALAAGLHDLEIRAYEYTGDEGLILRYQGPGLAKQVVPAAAFRREAILLRPPGAGGFVADPQRAARGAAAYAALGCASCHQPEISTQRVPAWPLAGAALQRGCLAEDAPPPSVPRFALDAGDLRELRRVLAAPARLLEPLSAAQRIDRTLEAYRCYACHARDGRGGPQDQRRAYFTIAGFGELGDEGRIPPDLTGVGAKLRRPWLQRVITEGARVRPYMATRMPAFDLPGLAGDFAAADGRPDDAVEPEFHPELADAGRHLVGAKGAGCINCHDVAGYASTGIPAVDLATVHQRILPAWFHRLLLDPAALKMNTRMPAFWWDGSRHFPEILDGDPRRQIDAVWCYLSLGNAMQPPEGVLIDASEYDLIAGDEPLLFGTFMEGLSPRVLAVGFPERTHYAYDRARQRLALAWRGEFMNAQGTWHARAGGLEQPAGTDLLRFPAGPPFAFLESADAPWPGETELLPLYEGRGYTLDRRGRPIFQYRVGAAEVTELPYPELGAGGGRLIRRFTVTAAPDAPRPWLRAAAGREIRALDAGGYQVDDSYRIVLRPAGAAARLRSDPSGMELRVAAPSELEVEYAW